MTNGALEKSSGGYPARFDVTNKKTGESMGVRINSEKDSLKYSKENNVTRIKPKE